jgi:erythromycin esterase
MTKILFGIFFSLLVVQATGQSSVKTYTTQNFKQVLTNDPNNDDYSDLNSIGEAIGNSDVVMLGEQGHRDAPTFLAKTRLLKYLIEKKGFTIVAIEGDFYSLNSGWLDLKNNKDSIKQFLQNNIFQTWAQCKQCDLLFTYLSENIFTSKIKLTGFDNQHNGLYFQQNYYNRQLKEFLDTSGIKLMQEPPLNVLSRAFTERNSSKNRQQRDSAWGFIISSLDSLFIKAKEKYGEANFWVQELKSNKTEMEMGFAYASGIGFKSDAIRDRQMADNLFWLLKNKYPGRKVIVWAANVHVAKKAVNNEINNEFMFKPMGGIFSAASLPVVKTYSIGFTSLRGSAGGFEEKHYQVPKYKSNSFESWVMDKNFDFGFVDFNRLSDRNEEFLMKGEMYHRYANADWANIFDAVFYVKEMYPCDELR